MRSQPRALLLMHPFFRPDRKGGARSRTEKDVWLGLKRLGYNCRISSSQEDLGELDRDLVEHRPHVVFNLLEEFRGEGVYDFHAVSFLEARGVPYTGCNPRGLIVSRNKLWSAWLGRSLGVPSPRTWLAREILRMNEPPMPLILKFNLEHASLGMTERNLVRSRALLERRILELRAQGGELAVQEFVEGREVSVAVLGNRRPIVFEPRELSLRSQRDFVTERMKFSSKLRARHGIRSRPLKVDGHVLAGLRSASLRMFRALNLSGYARLDFRLDSEGQFFLIDVNANPNLARDEDFAVSAVRTGLAYEELLCKIVKLAKEYTPLS